MKASGCGDMAASAAPPTKASRFHGKRKACLTYSFIPAPEADSLGIISDELGRSRTWTDSLIPRAGRRLERLDHVTDLVDDLHELWLPLHMLRGEVRWRHLQLLQDGARLRGED